MIVSFSNAMLNAQQPLLSTLAKTSWPVVCYSLHSRVAIRCLGRGPCFPIRFAIESSKRRAYSVANYEGSWEDPDDGSDDSEYEDDETGENDLDYESDWEGDGNVKAVVSKGEEESRRKYEEDLVKGQGPKFRMVAKKGPQSTSQKQEDIFVNSHVTVLLLNSTEVLFFWKNLKVRYLPCKSQKFDPQNAVEQLLKPEELAILEQNEAPNMEKLSTAKWKPFHTFALAGHIKFMDGLLEKGYNIEQVDKDGLTALHLAVIGKREAVISHLLRKGSNPEAQDQDGATPLHYAAQVGAMQTVKLLIKYKVDVNVADNEGWTPLHVAMQTRNRYIAKILLVNGADMTRRNKDGYTPLDLSLCYGKDFKSYDLAKVLKQVSASRSL